MTKSQQKKLRKEIVDAIGDEYKPTDDLLINQIIKNGPRSRSDAELEEDCKQ